MSHSHRSSRFASSVVLLGLLAAVVVPVRGQASPHLADLQRFGVEPVEFVVGQLDRHQLVVFDDGLHTMVEPFEFYARLVRDARFRQRARLVFLEVVPLNQQRHLDAYLAAEQADPALLAPAFQNDLGGTGLPYQTYFDLLATVHEVNRTLPDSARIRVVAVGSPSWWPEIRDTADLDNFRASLTAYDYTMFAMTNDVLESTGAKGILLVNTRHAYKGIRKGDNTLYWNTTTYFVERHPGRAVSIRFHAPQLVIERRARRPGVPRTTAGMEQMDYRWARMEGGAWDRAFRDHGNRPVAVPLERTVFGRAGYVGNHMLDAAPGQTMADAYDAVIFLAPLEALHQTAKTDVIYPASFLPELARRLALLNGTEWLDKAVRESGAGSVTAYLQREYAARPAVPLPQGQGLPEP